MLKLLGTLNNRTRNNLIFLHRFISEQGTGINQLNKVRYDERIMLGVRKKQDRNDY